MPIRKRKKQVYKKRKVSPLKVVVNTLIILFLIALALFISIIKDLPRPERFTEGIIYQSTKIYDRTGEILLYEISGEEKRTLIPLEKVPQSLVNTIIATEDKNFFKHEGVDVKAIARAVLYDLKIKKPVQGASTITQQLIRSYFLTQNKTIKRKTREIILSLELERRYDKEKILEWYLNLIPFGSNLYGVESASQTFLGKSVSEISLAESAVLTAMIKMPSYYSPYGSHKNELMERKNYVLRRSFEENYISREEMEEAQKKEIVFQPQKTTIQAPHFVMFVKEKLEKKYGRNFLNERGLKIITTIDMDIQKEAGRIVKNKAKEIEKFNAFNASLLAVNPQTGEIIAMVGSKDFFEESQPEGCQSGIDCKFDPQVNTTLSLRQPGSSIKPFIYALAFKKGFTPNSIVWDVKTEFNPNCPAEANREFSENNSKCYHPQNYDNRYVGPVNLRLALAQSRNIPSVKVLYLTGLTEVLDFIYNFGLKTLTDKNRYGLSLVLGGGEVRLLEMVMGYSVFANDGSMNPLKYIKRIEDVGGKIIEKNTNEEIKIIPSQIAREINDILSDNQARAPMFGVNSYLKLNNYEAAAKTGTTQSYRDAWLIGYTPQLVTGVWVGNNDNTPMNKKPAVLLAGPIWNEFMNKVLDKFPKENFKKPEKRIVENPILNGELKENHSILYFLNKDDPQYENWEKAVKNWLRIN